MSAVTWICLLKAKALRLKPPKTSCVTCKSIFGTSAKLFTAVRCRGVKIWRKPWHPKVYHPWPTILNSIPNRKLKPTPNGWMEESKSCAPPVPLVWALISLVIMNSKLYSLPIHQVLTFLYRCQICDPRQRAAFAAGLLSGGWPCRPRWRASHVYHVLYLFWPLLYALSQWIKLFPVLVGPCIWSLKINTKRFRKFPDWISSPDRGFTASQREWSDHSHLKGYLQYNLAVFHKGILSLMQVSCLR